MSFGEAAAVMTPNTSGSTPWGNSAEKGIVGNGNDVRDRNEKLSALVIHQKGEPVTLLKYQQGIAKVWATKAKPLDSYPLPHGQRVAEPGSKLKSKEINKSPDKFPRRVILLLPLGAPLVSKGRVTGRVFNSNELRQPPPPRNT